MATEIGDGMSAEDQAFRFGRMCARSACTIGVGFVRKPCAFERNLSESSWGPGVGDAFVLGWEAEIESMMQQGEVQLEVSP